MKNIILIFFLFSSTIVMSQGFTYTYTDPCTLKLKEITVNNPNGSISLIYNGVIQTFTPSQIINGSVESWIDDINSNNPLGPCSGEGLSLNTNINVILTQNNIAVMTSVMSIMDNMSSFSNSSLQGIIETEEKISSKNEEDDEIKSKNTINGTSSQSGTNENTRNGGGGQSDQKTNTDNEGGNSKSEYGSNTDKSTSSREESVKGVVDEKIDEMFNDNARNTSTVSRRTSSVRQGNLIMNGDIVTISSATGDEAQQVRVNMGIISSNTKNTFSKGILINYTSSINNTNITLFGSHKKNKFTKIFANSSMLNFEGDFFNTTSTMASYQSKRVTLTGGLNYTIGNLGDSKFHSLSTLGGGHTNFKVNKKMRATVMMVIVYSPYIYYYQNMWYQSGVLVVPFTSIDYSLGRTFKINVSFSGVQQVKDRALNYQILLGAKALL